MWHISRRIQAASCHALLSASPGWGQHAAAWGSAWYACHMQHRKVSRVTGVLITEWILSEYLVNTIVSARMQLLLLLVLLLLGSRPIDKADNKSSAVGSTAQRCGHFRFRCALSWSGTAQNSERGWARKSLGGGERLNNAARCLSNFKSEVNI